MKALVRLYKLFLAVNYLWPMSQVMYHDMHWEMLTQSNWILSIYQAQLKATIIQSIFIHLFIHSLNSFSSSVPDTAQGIRVIREMERVPVLHVRMGGSPLLFLHNRYFWNFLVKLIWNYRILLKTDLQATIINLLKIVTSTIAKQTCKLIVNQGNVSCKVR